MKLRLFLDEDSIRHGLVQALRARGVDVLTALEADMAERLDEDLLEYASAEGRVLYTCNISDFNHLHTAWLSEGKSHAGMILCRQHYSIGEQLRRVLKLITARSAEEMVNQAEFLSAWS
jgi:hypothetical protein